MAENQLSRAGFSGGDFPVLRSLRINFGFGTESLGILKKGCFSSGSLPSLCRNQVFSCPKWLPEVMSCLRGPGYPNELTDVTCHLLAMRFLCCLGMLVVSIAQIRAWGMNETEPLVDTSNMGFLKTRDPVLKGKPKGNHLAEVVPNLEKLPFLPTKHSPMIQEQNPKA